ncbi:unnamed protein product [Enterobius vermicularis]|uniref:UPAR/Ly6 domain-containing protein n=1 Tax=Enterobius vermicularis TaxID=51028 RepID=A0A0N4V134_ENTVE|nr:unnamed protein product [Enterobius vermicularis]
MSGEVGTKKYDFFNLVGCDPANVTADVGECTVIENEHYVNGLYSTAVTICNCDNGDTCNRGETKQFSPFLLVVLAVLCKTIKLQLLN